MLFCSSKKSGVSRDQLRCFVFHFCNIFTVYIKWMVLFFQNLLSVHYNNIISRESEAFIHQQKRKERKTMQSITNGSYTFNNFNEFQFFSCFSPFFSLSAAVVDLSIIANTFHSSVFIFFVSKHTNVIYQVHQRFQIYEQFNCKWTTLHCFCSIFFFYFHPLFCIP